MKIAWQRWPASVRGPVLFWGYRYSNAIKYDTGPGCRQDLGEGIKVTDAGLSATTGRHVVCTLAEGSYFYGVAALTNSLVLAGFDGTVTVGYRGCRPLWAASLKIMDKASQVYEVTPAVHLHFVELAGPWHLNNLKAYLINQIFEKHEDVGLIYYFDTDIVIKSAWSTWSSGRATVWSSHSTWPIPTCPRNMYIGGLGGTCQQDNLSNPANLLVT